MGNTPKTTDTELPPPRTHTPVEALKMQAPIYLTLYQTATGNVLDVFTGLGSNTAAHDHAHDWAQATALSTGKHVAVFGPQIAVYVPPPDMKPDATRLALSFPIVFTTAKSA